MSSGACLSLPDRLVTACFRGDVRASVNDRGSVPGWYLGVVPPLAAAVATERLDVAVWLLSHRADPNGFKVMYYCTTVSTAAILQLLIDAGGDVNQNNQSLACSGRGPLLEHAIDVEKVANVKVLLAHPSLDLTRKLDGKTPDQFALEDGKPALADVIAREVSGRLLGLVLAMLKSC